MDKTEPSLVQTSVAAVLLWFSGKDILAGMVDWLDSKAVDSSGAFRALLRDWVIANPKLRSSYCPNGNI